MGSKGGFRYADGFDKLLLLFGTLGCIGGGLQTPMTMLVLGSLIDDYAGGSGHSVSKHVIDKYALRLLGVAIGVALSSVIEGVCWTRTAERQTSRMRTEYLKSVLRQEVGFFEKQTDSSSTFQVIATITSDAQTIQEAYFRSIGYREDDGKMESTEHYLKRLESYVKMDGALVQTEITNCQNFHGLKEGWAWLARWLDLLSIKDYKSQFLKMLNVVSENFLVDLKSRNTPELARTVTEIQTYIEDKKFLQEPERWRQQPNYSPNGRFNNY